METPRLNSKRTHLHSSNVITPSLFVSTLAKNWSSLDCVTRRPERRNAACSSPLSSLPFLSWSILLNSAYSWCSVSLTNSENSLIKVSNVLANDGALSGGQLFAGDQLTIERYLAIPIRIHSLHNILKKCIRIPQCYKLVYQHAIPPYSRRRRQWLRTVLQPPQPLLEPVQVNMALSLRIQGLPECLHPGVLRVGSVVVHSRKPLWVCS